MNFCSSNLLKCQELLDLQLLGRINLLRSKISYMSWWCQTLNQLKQCLSLSAVQISLLPGRSPSGSHPPLDHHLESVDLLSLSLLNFKQPPSLHTRTWSAPPTLFSASSLSQLLLTENIHISQLSQTRNNFPLLLQMKSFLRRHRSSSRFSLYT